ncbi:MAG TPA: class I SAM-dependent methyltransferase [Candidatus Methanoperedens sp.]
MGKNIDFIDFSFLDGFNRTDNIRKYTSKNPLVRIAVKRFISSFLEMIEICDSKKLNRVLDAGTGEGILNHLIGKELKHLEMIGIDISMDNLNIAKQIVDGNLINGTLYNLPFKENSFDLTISMEVLEHLEKPEIAIQNIKQVTKKFAILSVPNDSFFRMANILRGKNISGFGNGPGHIQHYNEGSFIDLIKKDFEILMVKKPAQLWIMCLVVKR